MDDFFHKKNVFLRAQLYQLMCVSIITKNGQYLTERFVDIVHYSLGATNSTNLVIKMKNIT